MTAGIIGIIAAICVGIYAYIVSLKVRLEIHQNENASLKSRIQEQEWKAQIESISKQAIESERDYEKESTKFRNKHGNKLPGIGSEPNTGTKPQSDS